MKTIKIIIAVCLLVLSHRGQAQGYNSENIALENFLVRMYNNAPFEGVKIVSDYDNNYLLSVVLVKNSGSESTMNRVAQVKSNRQVSQFLGGLVSISSETIIKMSENTKSGQTIEEVTDIIKENSIGYTQSMQVLTVIDTPLGDKCYMFYRKIEKLTE